MALLDDVKLNLRISINTFDEAEIQPLIDACKADLKRVGIVNVNEEDPLIKRAIINYCKANYGFEDKAERFEKAYEHLKIALSLSDEYITP